MTQLIFALDAPDAPTALALIDATREAVDVYKVGLELFLAAGPDLLEAAAARGVPVFLDLKLHDIPNTVAGAIKSLKPFRFELLTIHAGGGQRMIQAAAAALKTYPEPRPKLLAVTVLTSLDEEELSALGWASTATARVELLAKMAVAAGADGLVCSPHELAGLRALLGRDTLLVTPGVRPSGSARGDQRRVMSPSEAARAGSSAIVVGRPIRLANDPASAALEIKQELESLL